MFLASIHFGLILMALVNRSLRPLHNPVLRFYCIALAVIAVITSMSLKLQGVNDSWGGAFLDGTFQVVSYASTSGFAIADNSTWPVLPCFMLVLVSLVCGCAGSTTGGLKVDRVIVLFKAIHMQILKTLYPSSIFEVRVGRRILHDEEIYPQVLYIAMYFLLLGGSAIMIMLMGDPYGHALVGSVASLGNVGPSIYDIGSMGNFNMEPVGIKFVYTVDMFLGRVEIYPVFAVISSIFNRRY